MSQPKAAHSVSTIFLYVEATVVFQKKPSSILSCTTVAKEGTVARNAAASQDIKRVCC